MKNLKYIILLVGLFVLFSCEKRYDANKDENTGPSIEIQNKNPLLEIEDWSHNLTDSLKNGYNYEFSLRSFDNKGDRQLKIDKPLNGQVFRYGKEVVYDVYTNITTDYIGGFTYISSSNINDNISLSVIDPYKLEQKATIKITKFENLLPNSDLKLIHLNNLDVFEYQIDASSSFDGDQNYGGEIINYQYVIDNDTNYHPYETMNYIFPLDKEYIVSVRVMDNNNQWSDFKSIANFRP